MADPFDVLRRDEAPLAPEPGFAAGLRRRLRAELEPLIRPLQHEEPTMSDVSTDAATARTHAAHAARARAEDAPASPLVPYLAVHDARAAIAFYDDVFGAVETMRFDDGTRIGHAELAIGPARVYLSDEYPELGVVGPRTLGGTTVALHLEVPDVDYSHERAVRHGATSLRAPADQGHGNRNATVLDPFGHRWMLSAPIDPARAERAAAADPGAASWQITGRRPVEVGYLTMPTSSVEAAAAFYGQVFDWEVDRGGGHIGNTRLPMGLAPVDVNGGGTVLYFRVDDVDPYLERAIAAGGRLVQRSSYSSGEDAECVDDQGFTFHIWRPAPGY